MFTKDTVAPLTINAKPNTNGVFSAAAFQYIVEPTLREEPSRDALRLLQQRSDGSSSIKRPQASGMSGHLGTTAPPAMYVRALYDYEADDHTSLSFRQGDTIQVITQLASGWWDGIINGVRGWFPSNYCAIISEPDRSSEIGTPEGPTFDHGPGSDGSNSEIRDREEAAFWIPQATPDGRLFYFNTLTGVSTMELPLETPTSANETGPRDRMNIHVPEQTRPPPELMASGYERDDGEYDDGDSASELECESLMHQSRGSLPQRRRSYVSDGVSPAASMESLDTSPTTRHLNPSEFDHPTLRMSAVQQVSASMPAIGTTSFTSNPIGAVSVAAIPRSFFDDGHTAPLTWNTLVENMRKSVESYRQAINNSDRSEYVRKAEDISDHLRMLLGAASGTTDNHSGNPSIISTNKALYPHFRDMMSRFSKLVLSSHIAAADWHAPDSLPKCLQEAEGVLHGVYGYVEVARSQRGEEIPRLVPGFVLGSNAGGSWQNNNLGTKDPMVPTSFMEQDDYESSLEPTTTLDARLLETMEGLKRMIVAGIRRLEEQLLVTDKLVTPARHEQIGNAICAAAGKVVGPLRSWLAAVESIDLGPIGSTLPNQQIIDFSTQKQRLYDLVMHLVVACQTVAAPLGDEWAEVRGDSLEDRLNEVRTTARHLETCTSQVGFSLQLLHDILLQESTTQPQPFRDAQVENSRPRTADGPIYPDSLLGLSKQLQGQHLQDSEHCHAKLDPVTGGNYRQDNSKVERFFGEVPARKMPNRDTEEVPSFLRLDHEGEISYDMKVSPPQLRGGTLTALVEQLTRHDRLDSGFNNTFLLTYRSFTTASELFELLVKRFSVQPPRNLSADDHKTWVDKKQKPIRFRVVNILKSWFDHFWMETADQANDQLLRRVYSFAKDSIATTSTSGSGPLMTAVEQRLKGQDTNAKRLVPTLSTQIPAPIMPKNLKKLKFLDVDATEFARQLTIIESGLYGKIKPTECLNKTWQKKIAPDEREPAANVKALILHSNQLTNWVAEMILNQSDVKKRVVVIKHFVSVADVSTPSENATAVLI